MPTYEYACAECGHEWETEQSIKDAALTDCPSCNAKAAKRQISKGAGFILKGGGWYSDLYASSSNKQSETKKPSTDTAAKTESSSKDSGGGGDKSGSSEGSGSSSSSGGSSSGGSPSSGASASAA
jgi:putative FmdB family regulatory protein